MTFLEEMSFLAATMTIKNVLDHYVKSLSSLYDGGEAVAISQWVVEDRLGISRTEISLRGGEIISEVKANDLAWKLMRLMKREPVQYVLGYAFFHGLKLKVNKSVLIPRPETEELVEWILVDERRNQPQRRRGAEKLKILDIGTGSGCIAIALKKNLQHAEVSAMDISEKALEIARENAKVNEVEVNFFQSDILTSDLRLPTSDFNIIVSNPPYILPSEKNSLHKNVLDHEPHEALFVPENDPLIFYKAILNFAEQSLSTNGGLYFEVNNSFAQQVASMLREKNFFEVEIRKDLSGKERMVKGLISPNGK